LNGSRCRFGSEYPVDEAEVDERVKEREREREKEKERVRETGLQSRSCHSE